MKSLLCVSLISLAAPFSAIAQTNAPKLKPLFFQAEKNNLQVLQQRFDYALEGENSLRVGNILIDTTKVGFELIPGENKNEYRMRFQWPAGLLRHGELAIKNNSGKAIFTSEITPEMSQIARTAKIESDSTDEQTDMAEFISDPLRPEVIEDMKYFPYMNFCVYRESEETKIYLCSRELYLTSSPEGISIKPRSVTKRQAFVEVNGKTLGNAGSIYLNNIEETVNFKTQTETGAFLEIETRMKSVDFKDAVLSPDESRVILTASGAEPVDESKVHIVSDTDWQIDVPRNRPLLYLKGEGDIPMRQEFNIRGNLPKEKDRPYLSGKSQQQTYARELIFTGVAPDGVQVAADPQDTKASLTILKKNQFQWKLSDLDPGQQRRYLTVRSGADTFFVGYDVARGRPFALGLSGQVNTPSGSLFASLDAQWWFENFLGLSADAFRFHWGLQVERMQHLADVSGEINADFSTVELIWRAQEGFYLQDETWGFSLPYRLISTEDASASTVGVGLFLQKKSPQMLSSLMAWNEYKILSFLGSTGDFDVHSAFEISARAFKPLNGSMSLRYGLSLSQYKFQPAADKEDPQLGLDAGVFWQF